VIGLGVADLVVIAGRTLDLDIEAVLDLFDAEAAERALADAVPTGPTGPAGPAGDADDPAGRAAALLDALLRRRPLRRDNQRVALVAMLQFLALNGWRLEPESPEATVNVMTELASGTIAARDVKAWLAPRLRCGNREATDAKEAPMRRWLPVPKRRAGRTGLFERFTDRARQAVHSAQDEARELRHNYIGTEHLLLGLLRGEQGVAAKTLLSLGISPEAILGQVEEIIGRGQVAPSGHIPFTPRAKKVLELSMREALRLGHHYIGTEHILLGLLREGEGVAALVLTNLGVDHGQVRDQVLRLLTDRWLGDDSPTRLVHMTVPADLLGYDAKIADVRRSKNAAIDQGDLDTAATLRDREKQLLTDKLRREREWTGGVDIQAVIGENHRAHREVERLRGLLRRHGIDPNGGAARSA
jgi:hypothetical protein